MVGLYKRYVQPVLQYGVLIYGCASTTELKRRNWSLNQIIRIIFWLKKFNSVREFREKINLLSTLELHLYELLKLRSKSLGPSIDCGCESQIFIGGEIHNIHFDEKILKTVDDVPIKKSQIPNKKLFFIMVYLDRERSEYLGRNKLLSPPWN